MVPFTWANAVAVRVWNSQPIDPALVTLTIRRAVPDIEVGVARAIVICADAKAGTAAVTMTNSETADEPSDRQK